MLEPAGAVDGPATRALLRSTGFQGAGQAIDVALGLASTAVTTRYLGPGPYGVVVTAMLVVTLLLAIADGGIGTITVRELGRADAADRPAVLSAVVALRTVTGSMATGIVLLLALLFRHDGELGPALAVLSPVLLVTSLQHACSASLQVDLRAQVLVVGDVTGRCAGLAVLAAAVAAHHGILGVLVALIVGYGVNAVVDVVVGLRHLRPARALAAPVVRALGLAALPVAGAVIVNQVYLRADGLLLFALRGRSAVGLYGIAYRVPEVLAGLPGLVMVGVLPVLVRRAADPRQLAAAATRLLPMMMVVGLPATLGAVALAPEVVTVVGGTAFAPAAAPMRLLCLAVLPMFAGAVLSGALMASGLERRLLRVTVLSLLVNLAANGLLIPLWSATGAALALVVTELVVVGALARLMMSTTGWHPRGSVSFRVVLAALALALVARAVADGLDGAGSVPALAAAVPAGAVAYVVLLRALGVSPWYDLRRLRAGRAT